MKHIDVQDIYKNYQDLSDSQITVCGWVKSVRDVKSFGFIDFTDGTSFKSLQIIIESDSLKNYEQVSKLNTGSSIIVTGQLILTPQNKQPFELKASEIQVESATDESYPLQKKRHSVEYLREIAYLRPRTNLFQAIFRIRSVAAHAIHSFFQQQGYVYTHTPLFTTADCEGSDQMFKVTTLDMQDLPKTQDGQTDFSKDMFGKPTYITGSGQLHAETFALAFKKVYTFGPTFRSENSNTKTHANEFWMIEPEVAFADLEDIMTVQENMLKSVVEYVLTQCPSEIDFLDQFIEKGLKQKLQTLVDSKFVRISHKEVIDILLKSKKEWEFTPDYQSDIAKEHERYICDYFNSPVFIKDWPKDIKAFYMRVNDDGKTVAAADLVVPLAGELIGGSQREERLDVLMDRMKQLDVNEKELWWYLNLRKFGGCKHAGFGMGFERLIMYLTGVDNIRDVIPYARTPKSCEY